MRENCFNKSRKVTYQLLLPILVWTIWYYLKLVPDVTSYLWFKKYYETFVVELFRERIFLYVQYTWSRKSLSYSKSSWIICVCMYNGWMYIVQRSTFQLLKFCAIALGNIFLAFEHRIIYSCCPDSRHARTFIYFPAKSFTC